MESSSSDLSPGMQEFIESMGLYFGQYNLPRIGGRILALMMVTERPLSLDDMAQLLLASRASISTNIRLLTSTGLAEQAGIPGDRRDYYRWPQNAWERATTIEIEGTRMLRRLIELGLSELSPGDGQARARLEESLFFCDMVIEAYTTIQRRWQQRQANDGGDGMSS